MLYRNNYCLADRRGRRNPFSLVQTQLGKTRAKAASNRAQLIDALLPA